MLRISDGSAARLIGDALDLRHRLRLIWAAAQAGQVPAYQARHIATATRHLTAEQAGWVDAQLAPSLGAVSWGRLQTLLEAESSRPTRSAPNNGPPRQRRSGSCGSAAAPSTA